MEIDSREIELRLIRNHIAMSLGSTFVGDLSPLECVKKLLADRKRIHDSIFQQSIGAESGVG